MENSLLVVVATGVVSIQKRLETPFLTCIELPQLIERYLLFTMGDTGIHTRMEC